MSRYEESPEGGERSKFGMAVVGAVGAFAIYKAAGFAYRYYEENQGKEWANPFQDKSPLDYGKDLLDLGHNLYEKGHKYWEQIKTLIEKTQAPDAQMPTFEEISPVQSRRLFDYAEIHADTYEDRRLTTELLGHWGLSPKHKLKINGLDIFFSDIYSFSQDRLAVVGYTRTSSTSVVARSYYLSKSQGLWRYLPSYDPYDGWFDKGHSEDSLNLPVEAQAALGVLAAKPPKLIQDPQFVFYGTARNRFQGGGRTYLDEVERDPEHLDGNFYSTRTVPPEKVDFVNPAQAPNFKQLQATWKNYSPMYGVVNMEVYNSSDGSYKYIFCKDEKGRAWIAAVENNTRIRSTGVRELWTAGGDLVMPLYEYKQQSGGYGSPTEHYGSYTQMWDNYLSKVPVIQRYLHSVRH